MVLLMMTISRMTLYVSMVSSARPLPCNCSLQLTTAFFLMVIHLVTTRGARGAVNRGPPVGSMLLTERNRELTHVFGQYAVMDSLTGLNSTTPCGRDLPLHCRLWKTTLAVLSGNFPWIPWKSSFRYILFHKKKTPNDAVMPQRQSQFTPKMKANAVSRLLSSLVWIDHYNECNGMTSFMEFM